MDKMIEMSQPVSTPIGVPLCSDRLICHSLDISGHRVTNIYFTTLLVEHNNIYIIRYEDK